MIYSKILDCQLQATYRPIISLIHHNALNVPKVHYDYLDVLKEFGM